MRLDRHLEMIEGGVKGRGVIHLVLSRRNLLSLLVKLDQGDSARTLVKDFPSARVVITSEDDPTHYAETTPGPMSAQTEEELVRIAQDMDARQQSAGGSD